MKITIVFSSILIAVLANIISAQVSNPPNGPSEEAARRIAAEQAARERRDAERREREFQRIRQIANGINPETGRPYGSPVTTTKKIKPGLSKRDKLATEITADDQKRYAAFLKGPRTGIVRLQDADICSPHDMLVKASAGCPDNIPGKATSYSFRTASYRIPVLADIFFKRGKLMGSGTLTFGIYANIGEQDLDVVNASSTGVKQLLDFQPPDLRDEIQRQFSIVSRGVLINDIVYSGSVDVKVDETYILRSVAYEGKLPSGEKAANVNILADDVRKDVTVVFRIVRQNSDGSIVLLWKELTRVDPPKIVLEAKGSSEPLPKNEFTR